MSVTLDSAYNLTDTFKNEASLIPIISNHCNTFGENLKEISELSSGYGIADIVFYNLNSSITEIRKDNNIDPIEDYDLVKVLTAINRSTADTINLTVLKNYIPTTKSSKIISYLIENQFLVPEDNSLTEFRKGVSYQIGLNEVVAIEAKLSNWRRGLYQAYRYRSFANKSYLALSSEYIHRALNHIDEFKISNVGLIEVSKDRIKIHSDPIREEIQENIYSATIYEKLLMAAKNSFPSI